MKRYEINSSGNLEECPNGSWRKNLDVEALENEINELLEEVKTIKGDIDYLEEINQEYASELDSVRDELNEYDRVKLLSADDKMRWEKMLELFPKFTWDTLKKIEDGEE